MPGKRRRRIIEGEERERTEQHIRKKWDF